MEEKILLSIITVTYNCEKSILKTIESVYRQDFKDYEILFIDGKSKDSTVETINSAARKYHLPYTLVSEPDRGIYDAMNKGICRAKGIYLLFLNSGDVLKDGVLSKALSAINKSDTNFPILYGNSRNIYINSKKEELVIDMFAPKNSKDFKGLNIGMCGLRHQAMLIPKYVFVKYGYYDLNFPISADWDHMITCVKRGIDFKYVPIVFCDYRMDGKSTHPNLIERHNIRKKHSIYRLIDIQLIKEFFSLQNIIRSILGQNIYNDFLFYFHKYWKK